MSPTEPESRSFPSSASLEALEADSVDAMIGIVEEAPAGIRKRSLYRDRFVTQMRAEHPAAGGELTLDRYLELEHVVVGITGSGRYSMQRRQAGREVTSQAAAVFISHARRAQPGPRQRPPSGGLSDCHISHSIELQQDWLRGPATDDTCG